LFCDPTTGDVLKLKLNDCGLVGKIPQSLADLRSLAQLRLDNNSLSGAIPDNLLGSSALVRAEFSRNALRGSLPALGCMVQFFVADMNFLDGDVTFRCNEPALETLSLSHNFLNGTLVNLVTAKQLSKVDLSFNRLCSFPELPVNVVDVQLRSNLFSGLIPLSRLQALQSLMRLDLSHNRLKLPEVLGSDGVIWPRLMRLMLNANLIDNPIRVLLVNHWLSPSMFEINLAGNKISGNFAQISSIQQRVKELGLIILNLGKFDWC